jgi:ABC-type uncharacterized transport system substrate-binding protein
MRRRDFIAGLSVAAWPIAARAQQRPAIPVVGFLAAGLPAEWTPMIAAFRQGLSDAGYVEGKNVDVEYRWAENQYDRLPALAAELVHRQVAAIIAVSSTPAALAAKAATTTIPVVFTAGADPVQYGLVGSFNRPGGNVTGVSFFTSQLAAKQFETIHGLVPNVSTIGVLVNPDNPYFGIDIRDIQEAARVLSRKVVVSHVNAERELDMAFRSFVEQGAGALHVPGDAFYWTRRTKIVELAALHALPAVYAQREFVDAGGLMSYGADAVGANRIAAGYVGRILSGEKPGELPVQQLTRIEMVLNMKAARILGLEVPAAILLRADEVIE